MPDQNDFEAKAAMKELDRINQRHPIEGPYAGLTREQHEARLKAMSERAAQANAEMDAANARPVVGDLRAASSARKGGSAGFKIG